MTIWSSHKFSKTGNIYPMDSASVATQQRIVHDKDLRVARRVYDPYAETQMSSATVNKNFQNPLSVYKNPKMAANVAWHPEFDYRFHPVRITGYNGALNNENNPEIVPSAYTKNVDNLLIDKQHVTSGTAINNDFDTDIVTPKNDAIANAVKHQVGNNPKATAPAPDKYWALNQNLYSPLVLDTKGNRVGDTMTVLTTDQDVNPSSQYMTQRYQIPVPLPRYDAFEPNAETKATLNDRFHDWTTHAHFPIILAVALVAGVLIFASGKKVI